MKWGNGLGGVTAQQLVTKESPIDPDRLRETPLTVELTALKSSLRKSHVLSCYAVSRTIQRNADPTLSNL